jgi:hypothetical protein
MQLKLHMGSGCSALLRRAAATAAARGPAAGGEGAEGDAGELSRRIQSETSAAGLSRLVQAAAAGGQAWADEHTADALRRLVAIRQGRAGAKQPGGAGLGGHRDDGGGGGDGGAAIAEAASGLALLVARGAAAAPPGGLAAALHLLASLPLSPAAAEQLRHGVGARLARELEG